MPKKTEGSLSCRDVSHSPTVSEGAYRSSCILHRILDPVWIDVNRFRIAQNGVWFWCRVLLHEEVERFVSEKLAKVVRGLVTWFSQEQNEFDVLGQSFTELRKLVFGVDAEELLNTINTEESYVTRIDGFTLNHSGDASNGSNYDMRPFLQLSPILLHVSPTHGKVGRDN